MTTLSDEYKEFTYFRYLLEETANIMENCLKALTSSEMKKFVSWHVRRLDYVNILCIMQIHIVARCTRQ